MNSEGMEQEQELSPQSRGVKRRVSNLDVDLTRRDSLESLPSFCMLPTVTTTLADTLEHIYMEKREELISEDGSICTPLKVLKDLAIEYGTPLEVITYEVHLPEEFPGQSNIRNRIFLQAGQFTGHGESTRHRLSVQLAAGDLLEQIKMEKGGDLPPYGLLPGCRISPLIYEDLREFCEMESLEGPPLYVQIDPSKIGSNNLFAFKCFIGRAEVEGTSDSIFLAKRIAAKNMYELLTNDAYPDDRIATGRGCIRFEDMQAMGIKPVTSARAKQRELFTTSNNQDDNTDNGSGQRKRRSVQDPVDGIHTDDFAEEEDHVLIVREQLNMMKLNDELVMKSKPAELGVDI